MSQFGIVSPFLLPVESPTFPEKFGNPTVRGLLLFSSSCLQQALKGQFEVGDEESRRNTLCDCHQPCPTHPQLPLWPWKEAPASLCPSTNLSSPLHSSP